MIPLRLVINTNIVVSAALKPDGLQRTVLLLAITKPARLYVTDAILAEYREVLARRKMNIPKGPPTAPTAYPKPRPHRDSREPAPGNAGPGRQQVSGMCRRRPRRLPGDGQPATFCEILEETKVITSREFIGIVAPHLIP